MKRPWILLVTFCCVAGLGLWWSSRPEPKAALKVETDQASRSSLVEQRGSAEESPADLAGLDLGDLIGADAEDHLVAAELVRRLPAAFGSGEQFMVASHLVNVTDERYYDLVAKVILDHEGLESSALDVILADLHLRDESIKLPMMAKITADKDHPAFQEAFGSLRTYFEDKGDELEDWQALAQAGGGE